jgi:hypothetical protein
MIPRSTSTISSTVPVKIPRPPRLIRLFPQVSLSLVLFICHLTSLDRLTGHHKRSSTTLKLGVFTSNWCNCRWSHRWLNHNHHHRAVVLLHWSTWAVEGTSGGQSNTNHIRRFTNCPCGGRICQTIQRLSLSRRIQWRGRVESSPNRISYWHLKAWKSSERPLMECIAVSWRKLEGACR